MKVHKKPRSFEHYHSFGVNNFIKFFSCDSQHIFSLYSPKRPCQALSNSLSETCIPSSLPVDFSVPQLYFVIAVLSLLLFLSHINLERPLIVGDNTPLIRFLCFPTIINRIRGHWSSSGNSRLSFILIFPPFLSFFKLCG